MDPIQSIQINKDSTFAMLLEAQSRGWTINYMELNDMFMRDGRPYAHCKTLGLFRDQDPWHEFQSHNTIALDSLDTILMRKDPPFNLEYIYTTYLLERAEAAGTLVVNQPQSLRDANEKMFTAWFPNCAPPTLITRSYSDIREFLAEHGDIILKPLDGMGGVSIFRVTQDDQNVNVVMETLTNHQTEFTMAQKYISEIKRGDKRILMIKGEPVPYALARIPAPGESRGNLAAGASSEGRELTERDLWICNQVGPILIEKGILFAGLDVIGDYLTEVNVTSPTCIRELDKIYGMNISKQLFNAIEQALGNPR